MHSAGEEELTPVQPTSSTGMSRDTKISFKYLVEVGAGHWNMRGSLSVAGGLLDIGCHTSLLRLKNGKFLVLDTIGECVCAGVCVLCLPSSRYSHGTYHW